MSSTVVWAASGDTCEGTLSAAACGVLRWTFASSAAGIDAWCEEHASGAAAAVTEAAPAGGAAAASWALGFAVFRPPPPAPGAAPPRVALVAIATPQRVLLARLASLRALPRGLAAVMADPALVKAGLGASLEAARLCREWNARGSHFVDLEDLVGADGADGAAGGGDGGMHIPMGGGGGDGGGAESRPAAPPRVPRRMPAALAGLARGIVPGLPPWRTKAVSLSDWAAAAPSRAQQQHAALEAWGALHALAVNGVQEVAARAAAARGDAALAPAAPALRVADGSVWHGWPVDLVPRGARPEESGGPMEGTRVAPAGAPGEPRDEPCVFAPLTAAAWALFERVRARRSDEALRARVRGRVGAAVCPGEPERVVLFGSSVNGMLLRDTSDADMCLLPPSTCRGAGGGKTERAERAADALAGAKAALGAAGFSEVLVPLVKFVDTASGLQCDLSTGNLLGLYNSALLRVYCESDPRVRPLIVIVKHWAKARGINSASTGTLSSYAFAIMVIAFLQRAGCVPVLQCEDLRSRVPPGAVSSARVDGCVVAFVRDAGAAMAAWAPPRDVASRRRESLGALLVGLMAHYATGTPAHGGPVDVSVAPAGAEAGADAGGGDGDGEAALVILDPFERGRDLARVLSREGRSDVRGEFARAHALLSAHAREPGALAALCEPVHVPAGAARDHEWTVIR